MQTTHSVTQSLDRSIMVSEAQEARRSPGVIRDRVATRPRQVGTSHIVLATRAETIATAAATAPMKSSQ